MDDNDLFWLDLALYYGFQYVKETDGSLTEQQSREDERRKRIEEVLHLLNIKLFDGKSGERFREYAVCVSAWFHYQPDSFKEKIDPQLLQVIDKFNLFKTEVEATAGINHYMDRYSCQVKAFDLHQMGIGFTTRGDDLHGATTQKWVEYSWHPHSIKQCIVCGKPFKPRRSEALYCGNRCKGIANRARIASQNAEN